jgi:hypothetical protein
MIHNNEIVLLPIDYITGIKEHIANRKQFINDINNSLLYDDILCDESKFKNYIEKKLLNLNHHDFHILSQLLQKSSISHVELFDQFIKKITNLFWLESLLNIKRFEVQNIIASNLDNIKNILLNNIDKLIVFYKNNNDIVTNINNIKNIHHLQELIKRIYKEFENNSLVSIKKQKKETNDDDMHDMILMWFNDNYKHTNNKNYICKMRDLYDDFSASNYFMNLTKNEKRKYNKSYFSDYVSSNSFLGKYHKEVHNNIKNCLVGWIKNMDNDLEDDTKLL